LIVADKNEQTFHVVFQSSNYQCRLFKLLHPRFQHCYVIKSSTCRRYWIRIETTVSQLNVDLLDADIFPNISDIISKNATLITIISRFTPETSSQLSILSCVDVTKRILGIKDFWCFTPYQLYKNILGDRYGKSIKSRARRCEKSSP